MNDRKTSIAFVRSVADTFDDSIKPQAVADTIDIELARQQHDAYVAELKSRVDTVVRIDADNRYPDCCFIEDPVFFAGDVAIMGRSAAQARSGEQDGIVPVLREHVEIVELDAPATIDGGDVLRIGHRVLIGLSQRSNQIAVEQVSEILSPRGFDVSGVEISNVLHLKSAATWLGANRVLYAPQHVDATVFGDMNLVAVPEDESYAANALFVNGGVIVSAGYPKVQRLVVDAGLDVVELGMSEFRKAGGSLTCLSLLL